jgi:chemotaxis protein methyltransferase CheR
MIWLQYIRPRFPSCSIEIVGIDLDETVLARAENALNETSSIREVPQEIRNRFFERENHLFRLSQEVKNMVQFKRLNFMKEALPQGMDLIFCRYLTFTYYTKKRRYDAAKRLWQSIRAGGFLVIGKKEGLGPEELTLFEPWENSEVIFRKKP